MKHVKQIICISILSVPLAAETNMVQGGHSIDWSRAGAAEIRLKHLEMQMQRLEKVNERINALPDFSKNRPSMAVVKEHAGLLEIKARTLISIRQTSTRSANDLLRALNHLEEADRKPTQKDQVLLEEMGMGENIKETYQKIRTAFEANRFNLQDAVLQLRMLAFAADRQIDYVRLVATNNRAALTRDFSQFTLRHGEMVTVNRSKDYPRTESSRRIEEKSPRKIVLYSR